MKPTHAPSLSTPPATSGDLPPAPYRAVDDRPVMLISLSVSRAIEQRAAEASGRHGLMARAGDAAAHFLLHHDASTTQPPQPARQIWLFAGPGNNGGDALCTAASLKREGVDAHICLPSPPSMSNADGQWALLQAREAGVPISASMPPDEVWKQADWMVDGLFGIGLNRGVSGVFAEIADKLSARTAAGGRTLALDIPSGLDAWTGMVIDGECAVEASHTMAFLAGKPGLFTGRGRDLAGTIVIAPLGIGDADVAAVQHALPPAHDPASAIALRGVELNAPARFVPSFPRRRASSHKGTFGSVAVIGGDTGTCGAAILSARAALYSGAGRVHTAMIGDGAPPYDPPHPEIMLRHIDAIALDSMDALAIGPGLGKSARAHAILRRALDLGLPTLIDADALNLISMHADLAERVRQHGDHIVITPHPGEASRLLNRSTHDIEADRIASAMALAERFRCTAVLKGSGTLIAAPDGRVAINATGNAGLSTGGTGDVLSGVVGAFLSQHLPPFEAALAATFLHGRAAEHLSERVPTNGQTDQPMWGQVSASMPGGPAGLSAGELAPAMRQLLNALLRAYRLA